MRQRKTMRFRRHQMVRRTWDGEGEALRLKLRNLICDAAEELADDAEYFDDAAAAEPLRTVPVRTLRGLMAWAGPDDAADGAEGDDRLLVLPGSTTIH